MGWLHGCALREGRVWCWGWPAPGGSAVPHPAYLAAPVPELANVIELRAGGKQTCARTSEALFCWGERFPEPGVNEPNVAIGEGFAMAFHAGPQRVAAEHVATFGVGRAHACALDGEGVVWCWGSNANGTIGAYAEPTAPHRVAEHATELDVGPWYTCWTQVERRRPERRCLGESAVSQSDAHELVWLEDQFASLACHLDAGRILCEEASAWAPEGMRIPEFQDVQTMAFGASHGCAVRADSSVWCFGVTNLLGVLGPERATNEAAPIAGLSAVQLGSGPFRTCALTADGEVACWGQNERGSVGVEREHEVVHTPMRVRRIPE